RKRATGRRACLCVTAEEPVNTGRTCRRPYAGRMQHPLSRAVRDAGTSRDDLRGPDNPRGYAMEYVGQDGAVPAVDETGDPKKDTSTAGARRQCTGTAGRIENRRVAAFPGCSAPAGHMFTNWELHLPQARTDDSPGPMTGLSRRHAAAPPCWNTSKTASSPPSATLSEPTTHMF